MLKTPREITDFHRNINKYIYNNEIKEAFDNLQLLIQDTQAWELTTQLEELEMSYRYMLQYFMNDSPDPGRESVYKRIKASLYKLVDDATFFFMQQQATGNYYQLVRTYETVTFSGLANELENLHEENSLTDLLEAGDEKNQKLQQYNFIQDDLLKKVFEKFYTSGRLNENDFETCKEFVKNNRLDLEDKSQVISGLLLNLMQRFDEKKMELLFDFYEETDENIRQRALIAILIIIYLYDRRIQLYDSVNNRLALLFDQETFKKQVRNIIMQFIRSKETEKITRIITDEIMPEMMKAGNIIRDKLISEDDTNDISSWEDKNPEWQEIFDESGIGDKIQEFANLQMEGADVFMSTFANLKTFPFFNKLNHWFLPFNKKYVGIYNNQLETKGIPDFLEMIMQSSFLCNSDKYSFCFTLMQMPENYRNVSMKQFKMESSEMQKVEKEEILLSESKKAESISKQCIQDLYRFFKLYPGRSSFIDIFSLPLNFHQTKTLKPILSDVETIRTIGELYFSKNFFKEAESIFRELTDKISTDNQLFEKIGYARQMSGNFEGALAAYMQSDIIRPDKPWTLKRIALCYRKLKQPEKALEYYRRLEELMPNNLTIQLNLGHCLFEQKKYDEALKYYFKIEFLDEKGTKAQRPIAWTSFLCGNFAQAKKYYQQILSDNPTPQDFLNAGHVELTTKNKKEAVEYYQKSILHKDGSKQTFLKDFEKDKADLIALDVDNEELPLLLDQLFYVISNE